MQFSTISSGNLLQLLLLPWWYVVFWTISILLLMKDHPFMYFKKWADYSSSFKIAGHPCSYHFYDPMLLSFLWSCLRPRIALFIPVLSANTIFFCSSNTEKCASFLYQIYDAVWITSGNSCWQVMFESCRYTRVFIQFVNPNIIQIMYQYIRVFIVFANPNITQIIYMAITINIDI